MQILMVLMSSTPLICGFVLLTDQNPLSPVFGEGYELTGAPASLMSYSKKNKKERKQAHCEIGVRHLQQIKKCTSVCPLPTVIVVASSKSNRPMLTRSTFCANSSVMHPPPALSFGNCSAVPGLWMINKFPSGSQLRNGCHGLPPIPCPGPPPGHLALGAPRSGSSIVLLLRILVESKTFTSRAKAPCVAVTDSKPHV
jgi:hypothetical protein